MNPYESFIHDKSQVEADGGFAPLWMPSFLFDFQAHLVEWSLRRGRAAIFADCGMGKGLPVDAKVLTPTGWRAIGSLGVGDPVIGRDGKPHAVKAVHWRGEQPTNRVRFDDGSKIVCDDDHLWCVRSQNDHARGKPWRVLSTKELRESSLHYGKNGARVWRIPLTDPVEFTSRAVPLHPYLLGVLLGDGSLGSGTPSWTKNDVEIADRIAGLLPPCVSVVRHDGKATEWSLVNEPRNPHVPNPVATAIRELGLSGKSAAEKFVPDVYLFTGVADRIALLQGLLDTDGYCGDPTPEFSSASKRLADAVVFLVQSLGGIATLACKSEPTYRYKGEARVGLPSWRVVILLPPGISPFSLPRKVEKYRPTSRGLGRWIDSITPNGVQETVCIAIDAADSLYVTEHFVVTHNTPMQLVWAENVVRKTNRNVLVLTPLAVSSQTIREAAKFGIEAHRPHGPRERTGITVTNYERLHHFDPNDFAGVVLDESSILKSFEGVTRAAITEFMRTVPYRLLCTATAAPNDFYELGTSSEALGYLGFMDMLARFFKNARNNASLGRAWASSGGGQPQWRFRGHAERPFWRWIASWARALRRPSDLGYDDSRFQLPRLIEREHVVQTPPPPGDLFSVPAIGLEEERKERRRTLVERCEFVAKLVEKSDSSVTWCHLNDEGDLLARIIPGAVQVSGRDSDEEKEEKFTAFTAGEVRVLVTKPVIGAWGLNWQHCAHMTAFSGHSFEQYYQSVRRLWRYGQTREVIVDHVLSAGEQRVMANLRRKMEQADAMFSSLANHVAESVVIERAQLKLDTEEEFPSWL